MEKWWNFRFFLKCWECWLPSEFPGWVWGWGRLWSTSFLVGKGAFYESSVRKLGWRLHDCHFRWCIDALDRVHKMSKSWCHGKLISDANYFRSLVINKNFEMSEKSTKNIEIVEGGAPALRVIRAETGWTVHRSVPLKFDFVSISAFALEQNFDNNRAVCFPNRWKTCVLFRNNENHQFSFVWVFAFVLDQTLVSYVLANRWRWLNF